jgi:hypothetical protein
MFIFFLEGFCQNSDWVIKDSSNIKTLERGCQIVEFSIPVAAPKSKSPHYNVTLYLSSSKNHKIFKILLCSSHLPYNLSASSMKDWGYNIFTIDYICIDSRLEVRKRRGKSDLFFSSISLKAHYSLLHPVSGVSSQKEKRLKCKVWKCNHPL